MHFEMAPNHNFMMNPLPMEPVSRTYQYRKIMKPMLERKRRARINKCLDELKDLMTGTLQADGENVSKLEKADILELTVRHLQRLRDSNALFVRNAEPMNMDKFWAGFQQCAVEVSQFLNKYDHAIGNDLYKHIANYIPQIATAKAAAAAAAAVNYQRLTAATAASMRGNLMFMPHTNATATHAHMPPNVSAPATAAATIKVLETQPPFAPSPPTHLLAAPAAVIQKQQQQRAHPYAKAMKMEEAGVWRPW